MKTNIIFFSLFFGALLSLVACMPDLSASQETQASSPSTEAPTEIPTISYTPSVSFTPAQIFPNLPTPSFTASPLPPLNDGSDLMTTTPNLYYKDLHYIQTIQDNMVIEPVNGVYKLSYTPFVFRYVSHINDTSYANFSFTNAFQNSAREGLDPFLPCPHPFCEENQLFMDQHIITIDENKYNYMHFCREKSLSKGDFWSWDRCTVYGTEPGMKSQVNEHDLRMFGLIVDDIFQSYPISQLRDFSDRIYITIYIHDINRVLKNAGNAEDPDFDLIKLILQFG